MGSKVLKILAYFFGIVAGVSLVTGVILRLAKGPWGPFFFGDCTPLLRALCPSLSLVCHCSWGSYFTRKEDEREKVTPLYRRAEVQKSRPDAMA